MVNISVPIRVGYVLFPGFTALDVFGPLNVFNLLSVDYPMTLSLISANMKPVPADRNIVDGVSYGGFGKGPSPFFTQYVNPTHTFDTAPDDLDVIMVPGGSGTRNLTSTQPAVDWLSKQFGESEEDWPLYMMSVCTGSALLARTGKIAGYNATSNKMAFKWVQTQEGADKVNWIAKARWVEHGRLWTSSGVSAGVDMTLGWVEHIYGRNVSENSRVVMEWNGLNQTDDPFADYYGLT